MQTWGVQTRRPWRLGWRGLLALLGTLGAGLASAAIQAGSLAYIMAALMVAAVSGLSPATPLPSMIVLAAGATTALLTAAVGARRAGLVIQFQDLAAAPLYWSLLSLAFVHALFRLILEPFAWDKTPHQPDAPSPAVADAGRQAA